MFRKVGRSKDKLWEPHVGNSALGESPLTRPSNGDSVSFPSKGKLWRVDSTTVQREIGYNHKILSLEFQIFFRNFLQMIFLKKKNTFDFFGFCDKDDASDIVESLRHLYTDFDEPKVQRPTKGERNERIMRSPPRRYHIAVTKSVHFWIIFVTTKYSLIGIFL